MPIRWLMAAIGLACVCEDASAERLIIYNHRIFIAARINGVRTAALLDSAAETTVVDPQLASQARLPAGEPVTIKGSGGNAEARVVEGVEIDALGLALHPDAVAVTDLSDISRRLIRRPVQLILGRELFDAARLQIDLQASNIDPIGREIIPPGIKLPLRTHAGNESLPVRVNNVAGQAEFDLGNGTDILISSSFADRLHLKVLGRSEGGGIGGKLLRKTVRLQVLEIAGTTFRNVRAAIDAQPSANDLNIGTRILRHFLITTDFAGHSIWLKAKMNEARPKLGLRSSANNENESQLGTVK